MATQPPDQNDQAKESLDLKALDSELESAINKQVQDKSNTISDLDKPDMVKKSTDNAASKKTSTVSSDKIRKDVERAFAEKKQPIPEEPFISELDKRKKIALGNVATFITQDKAVSRVWLPKIQSSLPQNLYGKLSAALAKPVTKVQGEADTIGYNQQLVALLERQNRLQVDTFIRNKADALIQHKLSFAGQYETNTILNRILVATQRSNQFFEGTFRKYLMTNIELKYKHLFVTQDILSHTKLLINTMSTKLDSVKHNTSLSDVAKISMFGEFKRTARQKLNNAIADSIISKYKQPVIELINKAVGKAKDTAASGISKLESPSLIEFDEDAETKVDYAKQKAGALIRKVKTGTADRNMSYQRPDMTASLLDEQRSSKGTPLDTIRNLVSKPKGITKSLLDTEEDQVPFDVLTRRSIVDIIPGFLGKIHKQAETIASILRFTSKKSLSDQDKDLFDKETAADELVFDKSTGEFTTKEQATIGIKKRLFGSKEDRTNAIEPIITKMYQGYKKHGGLEDIFKEALPDIVSFVTNIAKHVKIVKIAHIKKYLDGGTLTDVEQDYLDALFVDIPKEARKRLSFILSKTFFNDSSLTEIDKETSQDISNSLSQLIKERKNDLDAYNKLAKSGDIRNIPDVYDTSKGTLDHTTIRKMQSDVDHDTLVSRFSTPLSERAVQDASRRSGLPNRDDIQISGPGAYIQGADQELHIPIDGSDIRKKVKNVISSTQKEGATLREALLDNTKAIKDSITARFRKPIEKEEIPQSRMEFKSEGRWEPPKKETSQVEPTVDVLTKIKSMLEQQFSITNEIETNKLQVLNQLLVQTSMQHTAQGEADQKQHLPLWAQAVKLPFAGGVKLAKLGGKATKLYFKGVGAFYSGLFNMTKKIISRKKKDEGDRSGFGLLGGAFGLAKTAGGLAASVIGKLLGVEAKNLTGVAKGAFNLTRKLLTPKEVYVDVYRKNEVDLGKPLMKGLLIKSGQYVDGDGTPIKDSYSITGPVFDAKTQQLVVSSDDLKHGLVDSKNDPLVKRGSIIKGITGAAFKAAGTVIKGSFNLTKGMIGLTGDIIGSIFKLVPGVKGLLSKKKKGEGVGTVDKESLDTMVTQHLLTIISLLRPISEQTKGIREGSFADYERDKAAAASKKAARDQKKKMDEKREKVLSSKGGKAVGALGGLAALLGFGSKDGDGDSEGGLLGELASGAAGLFGGDYLKDKLKNKLGGLFGKKAVETVAGEGVKQAAKKGALRTIASGAGRLAFGTGVRSLVVSGASALAGAVSAPVAAAGLAAAGLGAGGYGLWNWLNGKDRRMSITRFRNAVYKVPEDKLSTLIDFEDDIAEALEDGKTGLSNSDIIDYMKDFGFEASNTDHYAFFKFWYSTVFFPIFKASYDIFTVDFKEDFEDQDDLEDTDLNKYKTALEESKTYDALKAIPFPLTLEGLKDWKKSPYFNVEVTNDEANKKAAQARMEMVSGLTEARKKEAAGGKDSGEFQKIQREKQDQVFDMYGDVSPYVEDNVVNDKGLREARKAPSPSGAVNKPGFWDSTKAAVGSAVSSFSGFGGGGAGIDDATPSDIKSDGELGSAVAKYESGSKGVASISGGAGDPGGASYGKYQLASKSGTLYKYLNSSGYAQQFQGMSPGSVPFNRKWLELAKNDPKFASSQHDFIKRTHFDPAIKEAARMGFPVDDKGIQEMIWSGSIQHGGIKKVIGETAAVPGFDKMSIEEKIKAYYKVRGNYAERNMRANGASSGVIASVANRYTQEVKDVLALAGTSVSGDPNAPQLASTIANPTIQSSPSAVTDTSGPASDTETYGVMQADAGAPVAPTAPTSPIAAVQQATSVPTPTAPITPPVPAPSTKSIVSTATDVPPDVVQSQHDKIKEQTESAANYQLQRILSGDAAKSEAEYQRKKAERKAAEQQTTASNTPTSETYIKQYVKTNEQKNTVSQITPAATNVTKNAEKVTAQVPATPAEVTVVDPEGKTQTNLLSQQNQLLSQIVSLMSQNQGNNPTNVTNQDSKLLLSKLDGVISAIQTTGQQNNLVASQPPPKSNPYDTRTVTQQTSSGIDVGRMKIS